MTNPANKSPKVDLETLYKETAELRQRYTAKKRPLTPCLWCLKSTAMRPDQKFCSPRCRAAYANAAKAEALTNREGHWQTERDGYVREIAALQHQIAGLEKRVAELGGDVRVNK